MTTEETTKVLSVLKAAYPNFYRNITKQEAIETINLYSEMFKNDDGKVVIIAVKELINTLQFPPTIADIKNKMLELTTERKTPSELWGELERALKDSIYHSKERFEELSPEVQKFVRDPAQLKEMAMMDSDVVHSVTKGQFFKQIEIIQKREDEDKKMLPESKKLKEMILNIGTDVKKLLK